VEPALVIKNFFDVSRIDLLLSYLRRVHEKGKTTKYITTLLINCFAKLGRKKELDNFLRVL